MKKLYKVYEIEENDKNSSNQKRFVGAYEYKIMAEKLCLYIGIMYKNAAVIRYDGITKDDINSLVETKGCDNAGAKEIAKKIRAYKKDDLEK